MNNSIGGVIFVVDDNIDTDQIIPAEYLTLVPSKPDEYEKLGSYAMIGLPDRFGKFIAPGAMKTIYPIIVAGENFGCGSSREHAPIALGAAGVKAVIAQSYARIFFRNCTATGELYPWESLERLCDEFVTGQEVTIDFDQNLLTNHTLNKEYQLQSLGDVKPVIDAGGIFAYARQTGMIAKVKWCNMMWSAKVYLEFLPMEDQLLKSTTRHIRIFSAEVSKDGELVPSNQVLTLDVDPDNEFNWNEDALQKLYRKFNELVEASSGADLTDYNLRRIGSDLEHFIRSLLQNGQISYNLNGRAINYSMGVPQIAVE